MGELKSAWEVAQEKASKLGKLSEEEERQQREQKCRQIGQGMTQRWLNNSSEQNLAAEINNYPGEESNLIRQATLGYLAEAIELKNSKIGSERAIQGIVSLGPKSQPIVERVTGLVQEYEQAKREIRQELQGKDRGILHQLRISGTAVGDINVEATPQWQQNEQRLLEAFSPRLDALKQELIKSLP
jgi:hypothetical protein